MAYEKTEHAQRRAQQRGILESDIDLVLQHGTQTDDGIVLTNRDVSNCVAEFRREIARLERLRGTAVFTAGRSVVSVYRPKKVKVRRMLKSENTTHRIGERNSRKSTRHQ